MPLGIREVLLVIRAKDQASRVVSDLGRSFTGLSRNSEEFAAALGKIHAGVALMGVGVGLVAAGATALSFFKSAADAARTYTQESALTLTQTDKLGLSLEDIKNIGRDVASAIPAPFKQMQGALYDIFSSMNVNGEQAKTLLTAIAKSGVAGQVDLQTAGRATIAIMNAYQVPVSDVNKVLDFQFQLVRKGVGTYQDFATTIGRGIPSAVRAGQSYQTLGAMLEFMTRNGLNATNATTSAARALDAISNPKVVTRLEAMGVTVKDSAGNYKPLVDILGQLNEKYQGLTKPELAAKLADLFKGAGGTIQARRFFDLVFANFAQFQGAVGDMQNSAGALQGAYDTMFNTPQTQMQALANKWDVLKTKIGDVVIPMITKLVEWGNKLLDMWNNLSPSTQKLIIQITVFASVFSIVAGIILIVVGAIVVFSGVLDLLGISFLGIIGIVGGAVLALGALAAIGYLIYKNWDTIKAAAERVWPYVQNAIQVVWNKMQEFWSWLNAQWSRFWDKDGEKLKKIWKEVTDVFIGAWNNVKQWWQQNGATILKDVINFAQDVGKNIESLVKTIQYWWDQISPTIFFVLDVIVTGIQKSLDYIKLIWNTFHDDIIGYLKGSWEIIKGVIVGAWDIISGIWKTITSLLRGDWSGAWDGIKQILKGAWEVIWGLLKGGFDQFKAIADAAWTAIKKIFSDAWNSIKGFFSNAWNDLKNIGSDIVNGLINGIVGMGKALEDAITGFIKDHIPGPVRKLLGLGSPSKLFMQYGQDIVNGLAEGLKNTRKVDEAIAGLNKAVTPGAATINSTLRYPVGGAGGARTLNISSGAIQVTVQGGGPDVAKQVEDGLSKALDTLLNDWKASKWVP